MRDFKAFWLLFILSLSAGPLSADWFSESPERADLLAGRAPQNSYLVASWSLGDYMGLGEEIRARLPLEAREMYDQAPMFLGTEPHTLLSWFSGRGYVSIGPGEEDVAATLALELDAPEKFGIWFEKILGDRAGIESSVRGDVKVWSRGESAGPTVMLGGGWLLVTVGVEEGDLHLRSLSGVGGLASDGSFQSAVKAADTPLSHAFFFWNITRSVARLEQSEGPLPTSLRALEYGAWSIDFNSHETLGLLKIKAGTALARAVSRPGRVDEKLMRLLPTNTSTMMAGDLAWVADVLEAVAEDSPELGPMAEFFDSNEYGDTRRAFTGRVAFGTEMLDHVLDEANEGFSDARGAGRLTACKSNLKNIGTALEMYSTDWSGHYPTEMSTLTPNYLKTIPECPEAGKDTYSRSLRTGKDAPGNDMQFEDYYHFYCEGDYHEETPVDYPQYNAFAGLDTGVPYTPPVAPVPPDSTMIVEVNDVAEAHRMLTRLTEQPKVSKLTQCKSNLKNLGTAMEMYSTDWSGKYPSTTAHLTPNYLRTIPECPSAGRDTYSESLQTGPDAKGNESGYQDYYYFDCHGHHHKQLEPNHPIYNGIIGLDEGPVKDIAEVVSEVVVPKVPTTTHSYQFEEGVLVLDPGRKVVVWAIGENADSLSQARRSESLPARLNEGLKWSDESSVFLAYNDLTGFFESALEMIRQDPGMPYGEIASSGLELLKEVTGELQDVQVVESRNDGLLLRGRGYNSSPAMGSVGLIGAAILVPNFVRARAQGELTACKSNLKNIGTALEMYSTDYSGRYPNEMDLLTPNYLRNIPECPAAEEVTYRLRTGLDAPGNDAGYEDYYHVECHGPNHTSVSGPENYPQYNAIEGLVER